MGFTTPSEGRQEEEAVPILNKAYNGEAEKEQVDNVEDDDEEKEEDVDGEEEEVRDGGAWAWMVVLASFICNVVIDGIGYSFGVLLAPMQKDFKAGAGEVAFVGSILAGVIMLTGPLAAMAVNRIGTRITCIVGSIVAGGAIFISSYSSSLILLVLSYGVLGGLGLGFMYVPAVVTVGQYFTKKLSFASGICVCGSGVGTIVFAPIASAFVQSMGWRGCNRMMALICAVGILCGLVLAPVKKNTRKQSTQENNNSSDMLTVLKNPYLLLIMLGNFFDPMGIYVTYYYLPSMAHSLGYSVSQASLLISVVGITNTVGRIISGWITDLPQVSALVMTILSTGLAAIFPILMPYATSYTVLAVFSGFFGFIISALPAVTTRLLVDILGIKHLNSSFGILTFVRGVSAFMGAPIAGFVLDMLHDEGSPFFISTIFIGLSAMIYLGVWILKRKSLRNRGEYTAI